MCPSLSARAIDDVTPCAGDNLSCVGLSQSEDACDVTVRIVERLSQDVGRSFLTRQVRQQHQKPGLDRLSLFHVGSGMSTGVDGFRQPRTDGDLTARARRLHHVDRESCRRRREERSSVADRGAVRCLPAHPHVLNHVFGIRRGAQHAVSDADQARTQPQKSREAVVGVHGSGRGNSGAAARHVKHWFLSRVGHDISWIMNFHVHGTRMWYGSRDQPVHLEALQEALARAAGGGVRTCRRGCHAKSRRPGDRCDQSEPRRTGSRAAVPRGFVLSVKCAATRVAASSCPARRHSLTRRSCD